MSCILFRYCRNMSTHRTRVSTTARTVSISAIVFDLIDFRVITIPDKTLPAVPKTEVKNRESYSDRLELSLHDIVTCKKLGTSVKCKLAF